MKSKKRKAINIALANLADAKERGEEAMISWEDIRRELFTPEEIAASDLRVSIMAELANARNSKGLSQRDLEDLSGVKQPIISRMEAGITSPQLDTVLKVLAPLGKTLYIGDINQHTVYEASYVSEKQPEYQNKRKV